EALSDERAAGAEAEPPRRAALEPVNASSTDRSPPRKRGSSNGIVGVLMWSWIPDRKSSVLDLRIFKRLTSGIPDVSAREGAEYGARLRRPRQRAVDHAHGVVDAVD